MLLAAALLPGFWSCSDEDVEPVAPEESDVVTLYLSTAPESTRATTIPGEDPYRENEVGHVDLYLFRTADGMGATGTPEAALIHVPSASIALSGYNDNSSLYKVQFKLNKEQVETLLFPSGTTTCYVRAVVNATADMIASIGETPTVQQIEEAKAVTPTSGNPTFKFATVPNNYLFLMYSPEALALKQDNATGAVIAANAGERLRVRRVAAKIRLGVQVDDAVYQDAETGATLAPITGVDGQDDETDDEFTARMEAGVQEGRIIKWVPVDDQMRVYISNAVSAARLDGYAGEHSSTDHHDALADGSRWLADGDYFDIEPSSGSNDGGDFTLSRLLGNVGSWDKNYPYVHAVPLYSYPNIWANNMDEKHRTYLTVVVPWETGNNGNTTTQYTSYQIPVNPALPGKLEDRDCLTSNTYYRIRLHIGVLGSFELEEPVELEASYEIMEWGQEEIGVELNNFRYLVVNQTEWAMNNTEEITVPFYTSHETVVKSVWISYTHFNDKTNGDTTVHIVKDAADLAGNYLSENATINAKTFEETGSYWYTYSIDENAKTLTFTHSLDLWKGRHEYEERVNVGSWLFPDYQYVMTKGDTDSDDEIQWFEKDGTNTAYSPFTITVVLVHKDKIGAPDEASFSETLTFTQYPSMYIVPTPNPRKTTGTNFNEGYVSVNNSSSTTGYSTSQNNRNRNYGTVTTANSNSSNTNYNMYTIVVTQLGLDSKYSIGDPRTLERNINLSDGSFTNPNGNGNNPTERWGNFSATGYEQGNGGRYNDITCYYSGPVDANSIYGDQKPNSDSRKIYYYYPTDETKKDVEGSKYYTIAPKYRVASSWGATNSIWNMEVARRRCATYQEFGYPAGRWRLPTMGEVSYIIDLSARGIMPRLFGAATGSTYYWTAHGIIRVNNEEGIVEEDVAKPNNTNVAVRCVYDDWYWVKEDGVTEDRLDQYGTFTWGDKPKTNPQEHQ